jgi:hypothetical protein
VALGPARWAIRAFRFMVFDLLCFPVPWVGRALERRNTQGRCLGRDGLVSVQFEDSTIWLGGHAVTCIEGALHA